MSGIRVALLIALLGACGRAEIDTKSMEDTTAPLLMDITTASVTASSAVITWSTDELATSIVEYGTSRSYGEATPLYGLTFDHRTTITGLLAATAYHYRVKSQDEAGNLATSDDFMLT